MLLLRDVDPPDTMMQALAVAAFVQLCTAAGCAFAALHHTVLGNVALHL